MVLPIVGLRATAAAKRKAATRKIARLRREGVDLAGTEFDPRVAVDRFKKYNTKQLNASIAKMDSFLSRTTQFVGDAKGRPIPRQEFNNYKRNIEKPYNAMIDRKRAKVQNLVLPNGVTVGERNKRLKEIRGMATDFDHIERNPSDFVSRSALKKVGASLKKQMTNGYQNKMLEKSRTVGAAMMHTIGRSDLAYILEELTDDQFSKLWNNTPFADEATSCYREEIDSSGAMVFSGDQDAELEKLLDWAGNQ